MSYRNEHLFITVPKNEAGIHEYENWIEQSDNLEQFKIDPEEYSRLIKSGVIRVLEGTYKDLYIADGESNEISADQLKAVYKAINVVPGVFLSAIDKAIQYGTCVYLDF